MIAALLACAGVPSELSRPNRVAIGPDGTVYVSDFHHDRIVTFGPDGGFVGTFGERGIGRGQLWRVTALATTADGALLVANRRPESEDRESGVTFEVVRFVDGEEVERTVLGGRTLQADGWVDAMAELPGGGGALVIADSTHGELIEVDRQGRRVGRFGGVLPIDATPSGLTRNGDDVWVVEQFRHRVGVIGPEARRVAAGVSASRLVPLPLDDLGHGPPRFPSAVGVCAGRWIAIADLGGHRVQRYDLSGKWIGEAIPEAVGPDQPVQLMDLAVSADCSRTWLVDSKGNRVLVTDEDGVVVGEIARW